MSAITTITFCENMSLKTCHTPSRGPSSPTLASPGSKSANPASAGRSRTQMMSSTMKTARMIAGIKNTQWWGRLSTMILPQS